MAKIDTVVFDLGGVLIDWNPHYLYRKIFEEEQEINFFLKEICHSDWNRAQDGGRTFEEAMQERLSVYPAYKDAIHSYYHRWEEMLGGAIAENVSVLEKLHQEQEIALYAITNWSHQTFPIALDKYKFLHYFRDIVVSGTEKLLKPEEAIYKTLLQRNHLQAEQCVFIDDVKENIEGAQRIGMQAIHLKPETQLAVELAKLGVPI